MKDIHEQAILKLCKYFEIDFKYKSTVTDELYFINRDTGTISRINPFENMNDCFMFVNLLIIAGYEFYLFFKQPTEINIDQKRIGWVSEIRFDGKSIFRSMCDYPEESIINVIEIFVDSKIKQTQN